jgi:predicted nucleic acid-binding protein
MQNKKSEWKYARLFLDTSALFKWIFPNFKEKGTENLNKYIETGIKISTSNYCIGELLGILKRKWNSKQENKSFGTENYLQAINFLNYKIDKSPMEIIQHNLPDNMGEAFKLVKKYNVDYLDASLVLFFRDSRTHDLFVTADKNLTSLALNLQISHWNILEEFEELD